MVLVGEGALAKSHFSEAFSICKSKLETKINRDVQIKFFPKHPCSSGFFSTTVFKKASGKPFFKFILAKCKQTTTLISIVAYSSTVLATAFEDKVRKKFFNFTCGKVYGHLERDFNLRWQGVRMLAEASPCLLLLVTAELQDESQPCRAGAALLSASGLLGP